MALDGLAAEAAEARTGLTDHPLRRQVVGEMQLRRFPAFTVPACIIQIVRIVDERDAEADALAALWPDLDDSARHCETMLAPQVRLSWERHSEASTATLVLTEDQISREWRSPAESRVIEALPGAVVRASRLIVVAQDGDAEEAVASADFTPAQLVTCRVRSPSGERARLWTDFRIHGDGYGRMVVSGGTMPLADLGRCVQALQELGNYRNLALLGLPVARAAWADLDTLEAGLDQVGRALSDGDDRDDVLLATLTRLSARLLAIDSRCGYRMSATAAYARIVANRLEQLAAEPITGYQSLADFTERRFQPAIHTCAALTDRLALLNARAAQFTALLRTRIETHIENQNGRLLASMDRSARMQLRLQHLVEGLSSVAISYYLLGLIGYPLKALEKQWPQLQVTLVLGLLAPVMIVILFISIRQARQRLVSDDKHLEYRP